MNQASMQPQCNPAVNALGPMIGVANVERSAKFYELLGFQVGNYVPREARPMHWAWLSQLQARNGKTGANLKLVREDKTSEGESPLVLYLYASDLVAWRQRLIESGIRVGLITYPEYLPKGELESHDPDGYTLMLAQSYERSPE